MGPGLRGPGRFVLAVALAAQAAPARPWEDAAAGLPSAAHSPHPIRDSIDRAVRRVLEAHVRPCAEANSRGVPCFPALVEVEGTRLSVVGSLRSYRPANSPSPSRPPTPAEMAPYGSGGPLSATGRVALGDPVCAVKSLWKRLKGEGGPYYLYRTWDSGGDEPLLTDHELDAEDFAARPDLRYELVGTFDGECAAVAAWRRVLREASAPSSP